MDNNTTETTYFRYFRNLQGELMSIDFAKQSRRRVPLFDRSCLTPDFHDQEEESAEMKELQDEVSYSLTPTERSTFLRLLDDFSIAELAKDDRVSRAAIYCRIHSMVPKNEYVKIWWERKNKINQHE